MFADEDTTDGSPEFGIVSCEFLGLGGRTLPFGVIQQIASAKFDGWAVAVGMMSPVGRLKLSPGIGYTQ